MKEHENVNTGRDLTGSRLKGSLIGESLTPTRMAMRGKLLDAMSGLVEVARDRDVIVSPEVGPYGTSVGRLTELGYQAWNSNRVSNQDAFALNPMARRFSVADGMGGYGADKTGTAFMARFVAAYAAEVGIADFKDPTKLPEVYRKAQSGFRHVSGREFEMPRLKGSGIGTVGTTLSYAEVLDATHVRIMAIGDSPIFVLDEELAPIAQYGEDSQSGRFDQPLAFKLGIDAGGAPLIPQFDAKAPDGRSIVDMTLEIPPNQYLALATDYFSEQNASRHIGELSGSTASAYDKHVSSYGKSDDATLIIIKPSALF